VDHGKKERRKEKKKIKGIVSEQLLNQIPTLAYLVKEFLQDEEKSQSKFKLPESVHEHVACDGCKMLPIRGIRYK